MEAGLGLREASARPPIAPNFSRAAVPLDADAAGQGVGRDTSGFWRAPAPVLCIGQAELDVEALCKEFPQRIRQLAEAEGGRFKM